MARDVVRAVREGRDELYSPFFWRYVMLAICLLPRPVFSRLRR